MLAGGMVIGAPSMVPEAAAAGQLFVSAENANFNNYFAGVQVVEIIVRDTKATEVDEKQQEPTVKVDEHLLRLAQGADGYWYAYIADSTNVKAAWDANLVANNNIHFGYLVDDATGTPTQGDPSDSVANIANTVHTFYESAIVGNAPALSFVSAAGAKVATANAEVGQIGIKENQWPMIQTFDFTIETFEIKLEQAGGDEIVVLTHDNDDIDNYASIVLDRNAATNGAHVHATITDQALNIDPTTEDIVMFNVTTGSEGVSFKATTGYTTSSAIPQNYTAFDNSFDDNGKLIINYGANGTAVLVDAITLDDAPVGATAGSTALTAQDKYLIFFETAENSGIFVNTDDADSSNLKVGDSALR
jgi:hypothetical protein